MVLLYAPYHQGSSRYSTADVFGLSLHKVFYSPNTPPPTFEWRCVSSVRMIAELGSYLRRELY